MTAVAIDISTKKPSVNKTGLKLKALLAGEPDLLRPLLKEALPETLEGEKAGALVAAWREMYAERVSTRKGKAVLEQLGRHGFSASTISAIYARLEERLSQFAERGLAEPYPYLILEGRSKPSQEAGGRQGRVVLMASGIGREGRRQALGVELAPRESAASWRDFLKQLCARGLHGVEFVVSDDHAGLRKAIAEVLPDAAWQCRAQLTYLSCARSALERLACAAGRTRGANRKPMLTSS